MTDTTQRPLLFLLLWSILLLPGVLAQTGEITLLAVTDAQGVLMGSTANLRLEIVPGSGRVFIESYPFTQLDTQISTRYAREIACAFVQRDCSKFDFFYTITAGAPIIGGPSAGGAIAVLTASLLEGLAYDSSIAMTGTINSGGVVGPVSGIAEKIRAAADENIQTVLIPYGTAKIKEPLISVDNDSLMSVENASVSLVEYGHSLGIRVIEVAELNDALEIFVGRRLYDSNVTVVVDPQYAVTMKFLADSLCNRTSTVLPRVVVNGTEAYSAYKEAERLIGEAKTALQNEKYYSAASFCFGANIQYRYAYALSDNVTHERALELMSALNHDITVLEAVVVQQPIETITDLQAFVVVNERIHDARELLNSSLQKLETNQTYLYELIYATERLYSAVSWAEFFQTPGAAYDLSAKRLEASCRSKVSEAQSRVSYAQLILPIALSDAPVQMSRMLALQAKGEFASCLFLASKQKAEANVILTTLGLDKSTLGGVLDTKMAIAERIIARQSEKGAFPVVGYSYLEYARELTESDPQSALLYVEYALELSDLDIYFSPSGYSKKIPPISDTLILIILVFLLGLVLGHSAGIRSKRLE